MGKMIKGRTYNTIRNFGFGLIFKAISIFLPFVLRTVMIRYMGLQYAGLNTLFTSILQVLNMTELGFGSALTFSLYKPIAEGNDEHICALMNLYKKVYRIIGLVTLCIGLSLLPFLKYLIKGEYPDDINIIVLYLVYLLNTALSYFMFAYKQALINAFQRNDVINKIHSFTYLFIYIFEILVVFFTRNYYFYIIFIPISTIIINLLANFACCKLFPNLKCKGDVSKQEKAEIFDKVKALVGHKIGGVVLNSLDSIVISAFLGIITVGIYGNYFYILTAVYGIIDIVYNAILASVGNALAVKNQNETYSLFMKVSFVFAWFVCNCSVCLISLYQPFMTLWVGEKGLFPLLTVCIIVAYFYSFKSRIIGLNFKDAAGLWKSDFWKPYIGLVVNLSTNLLLVQIIGINGVFLSTIFTMSGIYFPWETHVLFSELFKRSSKKYLLLYGLYTLETFLACALGYYFTNCLIVKHSVLLLIVRLFISILVANIVFIFFNIRNSQMRVFIVELKTKLRKSGKKVK